MTRSYPDDRPRPTLPDPFYVRPAPVDWATVWVWVGAFAVSLAFWTVAALAYTWATR